MIDAFVSGVFKDAHEQNRLCFASNVAALLSPKAFSRKMKKPAPSTDFSRLL